MTEKACNIIARIAGSVLVLMLAGIVTIQVPSVQTRLTTGIVNGLNEKTGGHISYSELKLMPSGAVVIKDATILDEAPYELDENGTGYAVRDTLFHAKLITATFSIRSFLGKSGIHIGRADVEGVQFHLVTEPWRDTLRHRSNFTSNIARIFNLPEAKDVIAQPGPDIFDIRKVKVTGLHFTLTNFCPPASAILHTKHCANYMDLDVTAEEVLGHSMKFSGGKMHAVCDGLYGMHEKGGYECQQISGTVTVGLGRTLVENLRIIDPWSDARFKYYSMTYRNTVEFSDFIDKVLLETEFERGCKLAMHTIALLSTDALYDNTIVWDIKKGHAKGYVSDLHLDNFQFTDSNSGVSGTVNARCTGIPNVRNMDFKARCTGIRFLTPQIDRFVNAWAPEAKLPFGKVAKGQRFVMDATMTGLLNSPTLTADIRSEIGSIKAAGTLDGILDSITKGLDIIAEADASEFDLGKAIGTTLIGPATFTAATKLHLKGEDSVIALDTLGVSDIDIKGKTFHDITIKAHYTGNDLSASISSDTPDLNIGLNAEGNCLKTPGCAILKLTGDAVLADFDPRKIVRSAGCSISASLQNVAENTHSGLISLENLRISDAGGIHEIGEADANLYLSPSDSHIGFASSFADLTFDSSKPIAQTIKDLKEVAVQRNLPSLYLTPAEMGETADASLATQFHGIRDLVTLLLPGYYVEDGTEASFKLKDGKLNGSISSPRLAKGSDNVKGLHAEINDNGDGINATIMGEQLRLKGLALSNAALTGFARNDAFSISAHYDNLATIDGMGELHLDGSISRDEDNDLVVKARPLGSYVQIKKDIWNLSESCFTLHGTDISIENFVLSCKDQAIILDGGISKNIENSLNVKIDNIDMAALDSFLDREFDIRGTINGRAYVISPTETQFGMMVRVDCSDILVGDHNVGGITIAGNWDESASRFNAYVCNTVAGRDALYATSFYAPADKHAKADITFNDFSAKALEPFLSGIFSETGGDINGHIYAEGRLPDLKFSSENTNLDNLLLKVGFTGVPYTLDGPFHLDGDGLFFDNISISDSGNGIGTLNGNVHLALKGGSSLNSAITFRNLELIKAPELNNKGFYGHILGTGRAGISGPFNDLQLDANVRTAGNGELHVPLSSSLVGATSDLLTFLEPEAELDPYERMMLEYKVTRKAKGNFTVNAAVSATPEVMAFLELDKVSGNILSVNGEGRADINIQTGRGRFDVNGDYNISGGKFHFNTAGIIDKEFKIRDGGTIKFNGDIMDTDLDITALYNLKASLNTLLADTTSVSTRRAVECAIHISDKLRKPQIDLDINVPDLDPTTKSQVESALNTTDKIQKQFASLLLINSFIPNEQSGIVNSNNVLYSNVSSILLGQVNSIFQKLEIPLDLGFNYQQGDGGTNIFDVAISTQLFNNRVEVNGSVGNRQYKNSGNSSNFVGDLDIDVKLDKPGTFRLNLFTHSADDYTNFLDYSQRSGIGVTYQKEFNILGDFFRRESRQQGARRSRGGRNRGSNTVTIEIEPDETKPGQ